jgi:hypothetical protein
VVNGDSIQTFGKWFSVRRSMSEPWLTQTGDGVLLVRMFASGGGVECQVTLEGEVLEPEALFEAQWHKKGTWPPDYFWSKTQSFSVFGGGSA